MVKAGEKPDSDLPHIEEKDHHLSNLIIHHQLQVITLLEGERVYGPYAARKLLSYQQSQYGFIIDNQVVGYSSRYHNVVWKSSRKLPQRLSGRTIGSRYTGWMLRSSSIYWGR